MTTRAGLAVETRFVGWGAGIEDFDNDGLPDLFYTTGMVYPEVEKGEPDAPFRTPNVLFRNLGEGKFEELFDLAGPAMKEVALQPRRWHSEISITTAISTSSS